MRLLIAVNENKGMDSTLSVHFGHCPFFAIFETDTREFNVVENKIDHSNNNITPVDQVMVHNPKVVFSLGMGERAKKLFAEKNVEVKTGDFKLVSEVIENIDKLTDLFKNCTH